MQGTVKLLLWTSHFKDTICQFTNLLYPQALALIVSFILPEPPENCVNFPNEQAYWKAERYSQLLRLIPINQNPEVALGTKDERISHNSKFWE